MSCVMRSSRLRSSAGAALAVLAALFLAACSAGASDQGPPRVQVTSESLSKAAVDTMKAGDLASAALLYQRAEELDPKSIEPPLQLGNIWAQLGSPRQAIGAYQRALAIEPRNAEAMRGLGNAQLQIGDAPAAISTLQAAGSIKPDWRVQNSLDVAYDLSGDFAQAQAAYRQGLQMAPGNLQLTGNLGLSLALSGNFDESLPMLEKAASDPQATPRIRQNLALAYGLAGNDQKAAEIAKIDLDPAQVQANLGYYEYLRLLHDRKALAAAVGARQAGGVPR